MSTSSCWRRPRAQYDFPDFDENSVATTFYTTGTTGNPKGVYFTHRQLVLHTMSACRHHGRRSTACRLLRTDDVYMPITPMFHVHAWGVPYVATLIGHQAGVSRPLRTRTAWSGVVAQGEGDLLPLRADHPANGPQLPRKARHTDFDGWKIAPGRQCAAIMRCTMRSRAPRACRCTPATACRKPGPLLCRALTCDDE